MQDKILAEIKNTIRNILIEKSKDAKSPTSEDPKPEKQDSKPEKQESKPEEKPAKEKKLAQGTISTKGAFGSGGRSMRFVAQSNARAKKQPDGLMKDLGVTSRASGSDTQQALFIFNQCIHKNDLMSQAYVGASFGDAVTVDGNKVSSAVIVTMGELDRKNGVRFLANVLEAAKASGKITLKGGLQFSYSSGDEIILYSA